jgi:hypothetical protein
MNKTQISLGYRGTNFNPEKFQWQNQKQTQKVHHHQVFYFTTKINFVDFLDGLCLKQIFDVKIFIFWWF